MINNELSILNKRFIYISTMFIVIIFNLLNGQEKPDWIDKLPVDKNFYWGRGSVDVVGFLSEQDKIKANELAFINISLSIKTVVSSQIESKYSDQINEIDTSFIDQFDQQSSLGTLSDIQGAEMVGDYKTMDTYWVLWKLDKATHNKNMEKFVESAKGQYEGFTYVEENDPVQQLQYLIPAYEDVIKVIGYPITFNGKNLKTEIPNKITSILNGLRFVIDGESQFSVQFGTSLAKPLKVKVIGLQGVNLSDIPVKYTFESGDGNFSKDLVLTSSKGKCETKIVKIFSRKSIQRVRAQINLSQWREDKLSKSNSFEKELEEISQSNSVSFILDVSAVTQEKIAVITVGDTSVYSENDLKRLNREYRSNFADVTEFKLKDEALIQGIIENYKRSASLCSNEECQVQIGKKLGVEKLIFVDVADYPKETSVTIFLRNIADNELEQEYTYSFKHNERTKKAEKMEVVLENIEYMVEDFWYRNNPAFLTMNCKTRGVKAEFEFLDPTEWMDKKFEKRLPISGQKFIEGTYAMDINKLGYEKYHMRFEVAMGDFPKFDIDLKQKNPRKAFIRSLLIPGRGQLYAFDVEHKGRLTMGLTYFVSTLSFVGFSGALWDQFFKARDVYDLSALDYQNSVEVEEILSKQTTMISKYDLMNEKRSNAVLVSSLTAGIWIINALDAFIFFPKEYKVRRFTFKARPTRVAGKNSLESGFNWTF